MKHEPNRQVSTEEQTLWEAANDEWERVDKEMISVTQVAVHRCGIHETRARQLVRTWDNEGLVSTAPTANKAVLTEYRRQVDAIESGAVSGESWRD